METTSSTTLPSVLIDHQKASDNDHESDIIKKNITGPIITCKRITKVIVFIVIVALMILSTRIIAKYLDIVRDQLRRLLGDVWLPIALGCVFSLWISISLNGATPTIISGVTFSNKWVAFLVAYISINIGAALNLLYIRCFVLKKEENACVKYTLKLLCINKVRRMQFVHKLFKTWNPIKILVILRLVYFNTGVVNYLSSFQANHVSVRQCLIGNAIGFLPGCVLLCYFSHQIQCLLHELSKEANSWNGIHKHRQELTIIACAGTVTVVAYGILIHYVRNIIRDSDVEIEKMESSDTAFV
eukprot:499047_1